MWQEGASGACLFHGLVCGLVAIPHRYGTNGPACRTIGHWLVMPLWREMFGQVRAPACFPFATTENHQMADHDLTRWQHEHDYSTGHLARAESRTRLVAVLTIVTMVVEVLAGWLTGSMALLADGWHMGSHAAALGVGAFAYAYARSRARDPRFTFGTGKVSTLAGYSSAILLVLVAFWMLVESVERLVVPVKVGYGEAMAVAVLGLVVNLLSAWLLGGHQEHHHHHHESHDHHHEHDDHHGHMDHNLRAAYLHVLADALTSVLAIGALAAGAWLGWTFLDPLAGIVGAVMVGRWAWQLARDCAWVLLDAEDHGATEESIRGALARDEDVEIADLHIWRVGPADRACIVSLVAHQPRPVEHYRQLLDPVPGIAHLTVEVNLCRDEGCPSA